MEGYKRAPRFKSYSARSKTFTPKIRKSLKRRKIDLNQDTEEETNRFTLKFQLVTEIQDLQKELAILRQIYNQQLLNYEEKTQKEISYQMKYKPSLTQKTKDQHELPFRVCELQGEVDEIDQQITFFKTLFTREKRDQIGSEVEEQKREVVHLKAQIQDITLDSELIFSSKEWEEMKKREHYMNTMKEAIKEHNNELKQLRKEGRKMMNEAKILQQKKDPIEEKIIEINKLNRRVENLKKQKEKKNEELDELKKNFEEKMFIISSFKDSSSSSPRKEKRKQKEKPRKTYQQENDEKEQQNEEEKYERKDHYYYQYQQNDEREPEETEDSTIFQMTQNKNVMKENEQQQQQNYYYDNNQQNNENIHNNKENLQDNDDGPHQNPPYDDVEP